MTQTDAPLGSRVVRAAFEAYLAQDRDAVERLLVEDFVVYDYELKAGGRYRNTELITVRQGRLAEVQVFFGGQVALAAGG